MPAMVSTPMITPTLLRARSLDEPGAGSRRCRRRIASRRLLERPSRRRPERQVSETFGKATHPKVFQ
jgi:hypothetical protein